MKKIVKKGKGKKEQENKKKKKKKKWGGREGTADEATKKE